MSTKQNKLLTMKKHYKTFDSPTPTIVITIKNSVLLMLLDSIIQFYLKLVIFNSIQFQITSIDQSMFI